MALINCPECEREISDKSINCIYCGFPLQQIQKQERVEPFPVLPENLHIGSQIVNWGGDACLNVKYYSDKKYANFANGNYEIGLHTHGLCISQQYITKLNIHKSQIIDIFEYKDVVTVDGNVVGNALVGGLLFGAVGAIVGGISGSGKKEVSGNIICIKFWDINTKSQVILSFLANGLPTKFINRCKTELLNPNKTVESNITEKEEKEKLEKQGKGCLIALGIAVALFVLFIIFLES